MNIFEKYINQFKDTFLSSKNDNKKKINILFIGANDCPNCKIHLDFFKKYSTKYKIYYIEFKELISTFTKEEAYKLISSPVSIPMLYIIDNDNYIETNLSYLDPKDH